MTDIPGTGKLKPKVDNNKKYSTPVPNPVISTKVISVIAKQDTKNKKNNIFTKKSDKFSERFIFYILIGVGFSIIILIISLIFNLKLLILLPFGPIASTLIFIIKVKFPKSLKDSDLIIKRY